MTSIELTKAKYTIANACNATGLQPADLVGVLSAVLAEARERMCVELASDNLRLDEMIMKMKEEDGHARNPDEERPEG